jgi:hypothetical protein
MIRYNNKGYLAGHKGMLQQKKKKEFLRKGYTVIYSSQDERIVHPDLRNYITNNLKDYIVPRGVVIIQHPTEDVLDITKPLLSQRSYQVSGAQGRSKPQILKKDIVWDSGMHKIPEGAKIDENIFLVDIGKCCTKIALDNNMITLNIYENVPYFYKYKTIEEVKKNFAKKSYKKINESLKKLPILF